MSDPIRDSRVVHPGLSDDDVIVKGHFSLSKLRSGLILHATDTIEQHNLTVDIDYQPSISIFMILDGGVEFCVDGQNFRFGNPSQDDDKPSLDGRILAVTKPTVLTRQTKRGAHTRKIYISVDPDWLQNSPLENASERDKIDEFVGQHLSVAKWKPSTRSVALAEQILNPPDLAPYLKSMYLESRAIELAVNAFQGLAGQLQETGPVECPTRKLLRTQAARNYIDENLDLPLSLLEIAQHAGFSVSSLQRHFKAALGTTVVDYVRIRKLTRAREAIEKQGMSVSEAAFLAGYTSSSSFATAFKRAFGISPKILRN